MSAPTISPFGGTRTLRNKCNIDYMLNPIYSENQAVKYDPNAETKLQGQNQILVKYPPFPLKEPEHFKFQVPEYKNDNFCPFVQRPVGLSTKEISIDRISSELYPCNIPPGSLLVQHGEDTRITSKEAYAKKTNEYY